MMIARRTQNILLELLGNFPVVALLGPRQVGKTTLALALADKFPIVYLDLQSTVNQVKLQNPELYLTEHQDKLVILDEVQRTPALFQNLRGLIDRGRREGRRNGRFLLLGSASIDLLKQSSESLAGRITVLPSTPNAPASLQHLVTRPGCVPTCSRTVAKFLLAHEDRVVEYHVQDKCE
jgi:uncharacterized protein